ncbi:MAG TPA: type II toxin-antitoxin system RelE/ParE family toxin [Caulobacteraceae bacterium]|nr:type II toxin-antitoxin system RelE/ParE family toxin [Caulobacteraceae bacterium]
MTGYSISPEAREDLDELAGYIARDSLSAAERVIDAIDEAFVALAARPGMGHRRGDLTRRAVRFWTVMGRYMIAYRKHCEGIEIVRVFGPGRDVAAELR